MVDRQSAESMVKVLGIVYIVFAALLFLGALFVLVGATIIDSGTSASGSANPWAEVEREMDLAADTMVLVFALVALLAAGLAALILATGIGLLRHRPWSRIAGIVCAVLALFSFPVGTIVGVFAIWLLGFDRETIALLSDRSRQPTGAAFTPPQGA